MLIDLHVHSHHTRGCTLAPAGRRAPRPGGRARRVAFTDLNTLEGLEEIRAAGREEGLLALMRRGDRRPIAATTSASSRIRPSVPPPPQLFGSATPWPVREVLAKVRELGGVAVAAHPYDKSVERPSGDVIFTLDGLAAVEGLNAHRAGPANDLAIEAADHMNLPCTGGSGRARGSSTNRQGRHALPGSGLEPRRTWSRSSGPGRSSASRSASRRRPRSAGPGTPAGAARPRRRPRGRATRPRRCGGRGQRGGRGGHGPRRERTRSGAQRYPVEPLAARSVPQERARRLPPGQLHSSVPAGRSIRFRSGSPQAISSARPLIPSSGSLRRIASRCSGGSDEKKGVGSSEVSSRSSSPRISSSSRRSAGARSRAAARRRRPRGRPTGGSGASSPRAARSPAGGELHLRGCRTGVPGGSTRSGGGGADGRAARALHAGRAPRRLLGERTSWRASAHSGPAYAATRR